jgi:RNA polymerase sigma factor for flagellar operon FliA
LKRATRATPESLWGKFLRTRRRAFKDELVVHYKPLVRMVADRLSLRLPRSVDLEDLVSSGNFGLLKSVEGFDPDKNVRFETYCRLRVRGAMIDFLRQQDWIPREARNRRSRLQDAIEELTGKLGREPTELELARHLKLSLDTLRSAINDVDFRAMVSLDSGENGSGDDRPDFFAEEPEPSDILHRREVYELARRELTAVERRLVDAYYFKGLTLKAIGKKEGISESRVCQIHGRMLDRLAERLENQA